MNAPCVFLSDVDGTLVRRDVPLGCEVIAAARSFTAHGGLLALCTGRSAPAAWAVAGALGVNTPSILYGGASLYDFASRTHLECHPFPLDVRYSVAQVLKYHPGVSMQVLTQGATYVLRRNRRLDERGVPEENTGPVRTLNEVEGAVLKLVLCCDDVEELSACRTYFPHKFCDFTFASRNFVDVVAQGFRKVDAVDALSARLAIPIGRFFCAGDGLTDLAMLKRAACSFAPENAVAAVRSAVDHVIPDVQAGGMATAFRIAEQMMLEG